MALPGQAALFAALALAAGSAVITPMGVAPGDATSSWR
jgi:hypothetical protein